MEIKQTFTWNRDICDRLGSTIQLCRLSEGTIKKQDQWLAPRSIVTLEKSTRDKCYARGLWTNSLLLFGQTGSIKPTDESCIPMYNRRERWKMGELLYSWKLRHISPPFSLSLLSSSTRVPTHLCKKIHKHLLSQTNIVAHGLNRLWVDDKKSIKNSKLRHLMDPNELAKHAATRKLLGFRKPLTKFMKFTWSAFCYIGVAMANRCMGVWESWRVIHPVQFLSSFFLFSHCFPYTSAFRWRQICHLRLTTSHWDANIAISNFCSMDHSSVWKPFNGRVPNQKFFFRIINENNMIILLSTTRANFRDNQEYQERTHGN